MLKQLLSLGFALCVFAEAGPSSKPLKISRLLRMARVDKGFVLTSGACAEEMVAVTGESTFSLPVILRSLDLEAVFPLPLGGQSEVAGSLAVKLESPDPMPAALPLEVGRSKILTLGEGYSGFLPYLVDNGYQAIAVDLWYDDDLTPLRRYPHYSHLLDYVREYRSSLVAGNVNDLANLTRSGTRFSLSAAGPFDLIVSHQMFDRLTPINKIKMITEGLTYLRAGGTFKIAFWQPSLRESLLRTGRQADLSLFNATELTAADRDEMAHDASLMLQAIRQYESNHPFKLHYKFSTGVLKYEGEGLPDNNNSVSLIEIRKSPAAR